MTVDGIVFICRPEGYAETKGTNGAVLRLTFGSSRQKNTVIHLVSVAETISKDNEKTNVVLTDKNIISEGLVTWTAQKEKGVDTAVITKMVVRNTDIQV